jgi:hypothetical protein
MTATTTPKAIAKEQKLPELATAAHRRGTLPAKQLKVTAGARLSPTVVC